MTNAVNAKPHWILTSIVRLCTFATGILCGVAVILLTQKAETPPSSRVVGVQLLYNFVTVSPGFDSFDELINKFRDDGGVYISSIPGAVVLNRSDLSMQHFEDDSVEFKQDLEDFASPLIRFHYYLPGKPDRGALTIAEAGRSSTHVLRICEGRLQMIPVDLGRSPKHEQCYLFVHARFARSPITSK